MSLIPEVQKIVDARKDCDCGRSDCWPNNNAVLLDDMATAIQRAVAYKCAQMAEKVASGCSSRMWEKRKGRPHEFCEDFGCHSFDDFAKDIRSAFGVED